MFRSMKRGAGARVFAASVALILAIYVSPSSLVRASASGIAIDTSNRTSVGAAYREVLARALKVPSGWTGSTASCQPGVVSEEAQAATLDAINFFRAMGGLDPVELDSELSRKSQEAALVMAANYNLSHNIPLDWKCRTDNAAQAAAASNLDFGAYGASAITDYMADPGSSNTSVGHRRWVLYPPTLQMGSGSTNTSNALWVINTTTARPGEYKDPQWVGWPTSGYFPSQLEPAGRWSLTANSRWDIDFSKASVTVVDSTGSSLALTKHVEVDGYGNDTLVWQLASPVLLPFDTTQVATFDVTVAGIQRVGLGTLPAHHYQVIMFDPTSFDIAPDPTISGTLTVDGELRVDTGLWSPAPDFFEYQWYRVDPRDGRTFDEIDGATKSTYRPSPSDVGSRLGVYVSARREGYTIAQRHSAPTDPVPRDLQSDEISAATPIVSDATPVTDQALTADPGVWGPSGVALKYQWYRRSPAGKTSSISGATASTYTVRSSDVGYRLRVKVTGSLAGFASVSRTSAYTSAVAKAVFSSAPTPSVPGVVRVSVPLTVVPGTWDPSASLKYQWYRVSSTGTSAITGATRATYTPTRSDQGRRLKVRVKAYRSGYATTTRDSAETTAVLPGVVAVAPKVSDTTPTVDQELTANEGPWLPADVAFSYQWYAKSSSGKVYTISGATSKSYQVDGKYAGYKIKVKVTGSHTDYAPVSKTSAYTNTVTRATFTTRAVPSISGTPQVEQTLTAVPGGWAPTPTSFRYLWYRSGTAIPTATGNTYVLTPNDLGKVIMVKVTALRNGYQSASVKSAPTTPVTR